MNSLGGSAQKNTGTLAVFENVGFFSAFIVLTHLARGHVVRYFRITPFFENLGLFTKYSGAGQLKRVIPGEIELGPQTKLNNEVLDSVDRVYNGYFAGRNFARQAELSTQSPLVHAVFKKEIAQHMLEKFQIFQRLDSFSRQCSGVVYYYPEDLSYRAPYVYRKFLDLARAGKVRVPATGVLLAAMSGIVQKLYWLLVFAAFPFWILFQSGLFHHDPAGKKEYRLGIRIYDNDLGFTPKYRSIDYLVNGACPSAHDTLFCIETGISGHYRETFREKGYDTVEIRTVLRTSGIIRAGRRVFLDIVPLWARSVLSLLGQPAFVIRLFIEIRHKNLLWDTFLEMYRLKHYVTYNDTMAADTVRNILLAARGTESWYYIHSIDNFDHYTPTTEGSLFREVLYSFLCFDHLVVWGDNSEQYYRSCPNAIGRYEKLGCLWSEHVAYVQQHPETNDVLASVREHFRTTMGAMPEKIISVYDTTAGGAQMPLQAADIGEFIDGIVGLLEQFPATGVVFKMKNPVWYMEGHFPEILAMYQKLIRHPRCYTTTGSQSDPSEVTAISDLVVSACFTSVTVEALGARKRAIYFDATGKFRNLYFDRFPGFVAHSADELRDLVRYWLYENSEQEFTTFLETHIKGELESYLDGKAITRFRERICS